MKVSERIMLATLLLNDAEESAKRYEKAKAKSALVVGGGEVDMHDSETAIKRRLVEARTQILKAMEGVK